MLTQVHNCQFVGLVDADDGGPPWAQSQVSIPLPPEMTAALIGDIIHNLRTSLDHMASELARLNQQSDKGVYFPFAENVHGLEEQIRNKNFRRCGRDAVDLLRTFRPYRGGNAELRAIHDLDVTDKHRSLVPRAEARLSRARTFKWEGPPFRNEEGVLGRKLQWIAPEVESIFYVFPDGSDLARRPLIDTLKEMVGLCEGILEAFAALKAGEHTSGDAASDQAAEAETHQILHVRVRMEPPEFANGKS